MFVDRSYLSSYLNQLTWFLVEWNFVFRTHAAESTETGIVVAERQEIEEGGERSWSDGPITSTLQRAMGRREETSRQQSQISTHVFCYYLNRLSRSY